MRFRTSAFSLVAALLAVAVDSSIARGALIVTPGTPFDGDILTCVDVVGEPWPFPQMCLTTPAGQSAPTFHLQTVGPNVTLVVSNGAHFLSLSFDTAADSLAVTSNDRFFFQGVVYDAGEVITQGVAAWLTQEVTVGQTGRLCTVIAATPTLGLCDDNGCRAVGGFCRAIDTDDDGIRDDCVCVPEIQPGSAAGATTLLFGGVLMLTGRRRPQPA